MPDVFPLDRQRPVVVDLVERADDLLEVDAAAPRRAKLPAAARIAKLQMARQDAAAAVERHDRVLDVHVIDAIGKRANELDRIDPLPQQMAGIEVEAELLAAIERLQRPLGRVDSRRRFRSDALPARTARRIRRTRRGSD